MYCLECFPFDLRKVKKININENGVFYVIVILLTPLSNCQGTRSRRKEEEETKGVVLLWAESSLSSLKWRDGSQSSVLLKHANAMKQWNQNQNTAFPAEKKKEKDFKSLFIQLWKNTSVNHWAESVDSFGFDSYCHTLRESVALKSHIQKEMSLPCLLSDPLLALHWVKKILMKTSVIGGTD